MNSKPLLSITEGDLKKWREGGRSERTLLLLFALAILAMVLIGIRVVWSAPAPQSGPQTGQHPGWHHGMGPMGPEQELGWLSDKLQLTDEQKAKIKPLIEDEHKQLAALREDTSLSREDKRAKFRQIHTNTYDQIRPLLTEQQQAKWQQIEEQRQQRMKNRQEKGGPPPVS